MIWPVPGMKQRAGRSPVQRMLVRAGVINVLLRQEAELSFVKREQWTEEEILGLPAGEHDYFERKGGIAPICRRCCRPCTRPLGSILHAVAVHAPDIVQPSHYAKIDDLLDGLRARVSAIISQEAMS
jgi:hypothetical protein